MDASPTTALIPAFVNPLAGNARAARDALSAAGGFDVRDVHPERIQDSVRRAIADGAKRLVIAGGDGSIGSAAAVLAGTEVELAILPSGTLNHLAKDLALPLDLEAAARVARTGQTRLVDAATLNGRLFLNTSSVGAYAIFVRIRERLERYLGYHLASFIAALRLVVRLPLFRVTLVAEGRAREYLTPLVFIGVGERELKLPALGGRIADGRAGLHVMIIRRRSGARTLALAFAAAARGVDAVARTPALDAFLVDEVKIEPRTHSAAVDGEILRVSPPLVYRHVPGCLRVVVGEGSPDLAAPDVDATMRGEQARSFRG